MKIKIWIENEEKETVKNMGIVVCDSVARALQMYDDDIAGYEDKGMAVRLCYVIMNKLSTNGKKVRNER